MASLYGTGTGVSLSGLQTNSYNDITADTATITTLNSTTGNITTLNTTTLTSTNVNSTNLTGTLQTASQPNITSVGTLPTATITTLNSTTGNITTVNSTDVNSTNLTGTLLTTTQPLRNIVPSTNQLYIGNVATNTYIEITPTTSIIDFISSAVGSTDYNGRIRCTGGTATTGSGTMTHTATAHNFVGSVSSTGRYTCTAVDENAFLHNIATAQSYTKSFTGLNSEMTDGQYVQISIGKEQNTNCCVEIAHQYNGTTPADNKLKLGFNGNNDLFSLNQLGDAVLNRNLTLGNQTTTVNAHGSNTLSSCNTIGTENTTTSTFFNTTFTSNTSVAGYTCSASTNSSTAYQGCGSSSSAQWSSSIGQYQTAGTYDYGSIYFFYDNVSNTKVTGEYVRVDMPVSVKVSTVSVNLLGTGGFYVASVKILISPDGVSWFVGNTTTYTSNRTGTQSYSITGIASTLYARSVVFLVPTMRTGTNSYPSINQFYISSGSVSTSPTESIYIPRSLELGTSVGSSLPSQVLKVNGTATFNSRVELNDVSYVSANMVFDTTNYNEGFLINYKNIFCKVYIEATGSVSPNTSFWFPTRGSNVILDNTGVAEYGFIAISYTISSFNYGGTYRVFYDGIYRVSYTIRTGDVVDTTNGFMPKYYNPTTSAYVNIIPSDGVFWGVRDGGNRTIICYTTLVRLLKGYALMATTYDATTQSWAEMTVEYVSNYNA